MKRSAIASGDLRDVYFYPDQLNGHTERIYRPGSDLNPGELVRGANKAVEHARLVEEMPAIGNDVELDLRPRLFQAPCGYRRRAGIVPALDDHAGDSAQLRRASKQLPFIEPAVVDHVVVLDPRDGNGDFRAGEMLDR